MFTTTNFIFLIIVSVVSSEKVYTLCEHRHISNYGIHTYTQDCSEKKLINIPVISPGVNHLDVSKNQIRILDTEKNKIESKSLRTLTLSNNNIADISDNFFDHVKNLTELNLSHNDIIKLDSKLFQHLSELQKLDLSYNDLTKLPDGIFEHLHSLKELNLSYNFLGTFLMSSKTMLNDVLKLDKNVENLGLEGLKLNHIDGAYFEEYKKLTSITLAYNEFDNIPNIPYSTEVLDLSGNKLTFISARYLNYHSLKVLKLNGMKTLTNIHHYAFYNLYSLEKLYINDCPNLKNFSELAFDFAKKNNHLHPKVLSLARNGIQSLNETYKYFFDHMYQIDIRHNPWTCDCDILWLQEFNGKFYREEELRYVFLIFVTGTTLNVKNPHLDHSGYSDWHFQ